VFDLNKYMATRRAEVEAALDRFLPPDTAQPARLHEAMRYSTLSPGKRLRPVLCLAAAEAVGIGRGAESADAAIRAAAALEFFHAYTLIHDDLPCMDDDDLRRGRPTCHVVYGEAVAVLAGDALQCLAFDVLANAAHAGKAARLAAELARAGGSAGVVGGQADDMGEMENRIDESALTGIHMRKTAALFAAAARMGGIAAGAEDAAIGGLGRYGTALGLAFQIVDDLLDAEGEKKPGEMSCLLVFDATEARRRVARLTADATAAIESAAPPERARPLRALAEMLVTRTA
jgi:geranylgeranyl pyrophosphate synthase